MTKLFKNLRVLVVDDSRAMRRIIRGYLSQGGVSRIAEAEHGRAAMDLIGFQELDLVVSDLNMPVMSGMELLAAVKSDARFQHICFVVLTVEAVQTTMNQALDMGADAYIVKPVEQDVFIREIRKVLVKRDRV